jgi:hypothetical protein
LECPVLMGICTKFDINMMTCQEWEDY